MGDSPASARSRYAAVLVAVVSLALLAGWYVTRSPLDERLLFAIPLVALVVAGVEWDRILRHGLAV